MGFLNKEIYHMGFFEKLTFKVLMFFRNLIFAVGRFFKKLPGRIFTLLKQIVKAFANYLKGFKEGGLGVKFSYLFMGAGNLSAGQTVKGLLYLFIEALFVVYMILFGGAAFVGLFTLGTTPMSEVGGVDEWGNPIVAHGDNSLLMLLYGVITLLIIIAFIAVYATSIKSGIKAQACIKNQIKPTTFKEDLKGLLDQNLYRSMLFLPIVCILAFTIVPLIYMILMAFTSYDHNHLPPGSLFDWTGFASFGRIFGSSTIGKTFFPVLGWTLIWAVLATVTNFFGGIIVALIINRKGVKGKKIYRMIFVMTIAIPQFITLMTMRNFLHVDGPVNSFLMNAGWISSRIDFLKNPALNALLPRVMVLTVNLWIGIPYTMLITTGVLMNIPAELYEAARLDGASSVRLLVSITMPFILFITGPYLIQQFIGNINNFNIIYLLSEGGPASAEYYIAGKTDLLITWLYKLTIEQNDYNIGAAIGIMTFIVCAGFSLLAYTQTASYKREEDFS